jgi:hypothetical protein
MISEQVKQISGIILNEYPDMDPDLVNRILTVNLEGYYGLRK